MQENTDQKKLRIWTLFAQRKSTLDWSRVFCNHSSYEKYKTLAEILTNNFCKFLSHNIEKCDYKTPEWINKSIILSLKKQQKPIKR